MDFEVEDQQGRDAPTRRRRGRFGFPKVSLSLSAFVMSATITLIGAYYALQGPEVLVRAPEQVILYRDGEGQDSVLGIALRVDMINTAADYGDVLLEAKIGPADGVASFDYQGIATPVFTDSAEDIADKCDVGSRCISLPRLLLVERSDQLLDLPGGAARAMNLSFPLASWNCEGSQINCSAYSNFDAAVAAVAEKELKLKMKLQFHGDGERDVTCGGAKINGNYLRQVGWISLSCASAKVTGDPML